MHLSATRRRQISRVAGVVTVTLVSALAGATFVQPAFAQGKPAGSAAQTPQARAADLFNKGAEAYRRGEFAQAVSMLQEAYSLDPQPVLLYNLARAYEGSGSNDLAIETYARYLEADPKAPDRGAIEQRLGTLKRQRDERIALEKQRDAERARADQEKADRERRQQEQPKAAAPHERSIGPYVVAGVGGAALVSGAIFGLMATSKHSTANQASTSQQSAVDEQSSAKSLATISTISFIAGGVLVAAGVTWWFIDGKSVDKQGKSAATPFRVGLAPGFLLLERALP
jgi:tetratricopeptide (TPR) repeat protein